MTVQAVDHVEFFVGDALQAAHYHCCTFGFTVVAEAGPQTGLAGARSFVLAHGGVRVVVTSGLHSDHPAARFVAAHGDGVRDVALRTDDAVGDFARAVAAGATVVAEPQTFDSGDGPVTVATIAVTNDLVHTLVQRDNPSGEFLPGRYRSTADADPPTPQLFHSVDHIALCLRPGSLTTMVDFYQRVLGLRRTYDEYIVVGGQAMDSRVVQDESGRVTFTMVEPAPDSEQGQLNDFLDGFHGPGVQHVAYGTDDIVKAVGTLRGLGVEFLNTPASYYSSLPERNIELDIDPRCLEELGLLVDRDEWGHLVQVFTRSPYARRTVFFELIQRMDARTFGSGNIKALYESVERERRKASEAAVPVGAGAQVAG